MEVQLFVMLGSISTQAGTLKARSLHRISHIETQALNASVPVPVGYRKHGGVEREGTVQPATETSSNGATIASRMVINAPSSQSLNTTSTCIRVMANNLSGH
jgi:hypothetical protein